MPLLKLLLVLVFVHQDEVDLPHAVVEEQRVGLVVELGLGAETRIVRELRRLELQHLLLHDVVHDAQRQGSRAPTAGLTPAKVFIQTGTRDESTDVSSPALRLSANCVHTARLMPANEELTSNGFHVKLGDLSSHQSEPTEHQI